MSLALDSKAQPQAARSGTGRRGCRILVVEDDDEMRRWVAETLEEDGFETVTAPDALSAVISILAWDADVVVTDWKMPGLDGLELIDAIGRLAPGTPIVLVTAFVEPGLRERIRRKGASSLLEKPFRREELLAHVRGALRM